MTAHSLSLVEEVETIVIHITLVSPHPYVCIWASSKIAKSEVCVTCVYLYSRKCLKLCVCPAVQYTVEVETVFIYCMRVEVVVVVWLVLVVLAQVFFACL
jgi:hypothetical protein